jgi:hypothetical protein
VAEHVEAGVERPEGVGAAHQVSRLVRRLPAWCLLCLSRPPRQDRFLGTA